jgi:hypothetical protein
MVGKLEPYSLLGFLVLSLLTYAVRVDEVLGLFPTAATLCGGDYCSAPMSDFFIAP